MLELDGVVVSSTKIWAVIDRGDVEHAAAMLGRPHMVHGVVLRGNQRGTGLGFPTANLQIDPRVAVPAPGVYAGVFTGPSGSHACVTSVGHNPTFGGSELAGSRPHLLDHSEDLYGVTAAVDSRHHIREERTYPTADALVAEMHNDAATARRLLSNQSP